MKDERKSLGGHKDDVDDKRWLAMSGTHESHPRLGSLYQQQ